MAKMTAAERDKEIQRLRDHNTRLNATIERAEAAKRVEDQKIERARLTQRENDEQVAWLENMPARLVTREKGDTATE